MTKYEPIPRDDIIRRMAEIRAALDLLMDLGRLSDQGTRQAKELRLELAELREELRD